MISLDQVYLLEKKVESAVAKIAQLNAENAALRSKCAELTNALSAKTEQFSTFEDDQSKIESGLLKILERLNDVENTVLSFEDSTDSDSVQSSVISAGSDTEQSISDTQPKTDAVEQSVTVSFDTATPIEADVSSQQVLPQTEQSFTEDTDVSGDSEKQNEELASNNADTTADEQNKDNTPEQGQFDIF